MSDMNLANRIYRRALLELDLIDDDWQVDENRIPYLYPSWPLFAEVTKFSALAAREVEDTLDVVALVGPYRGRCGLCLDSDARHRVLDDVAGRVAAGEDVDSIAADHHLTALAVTRIAAEYDPTPETWDCEDDDQDDDGEVRPVEDVPHAGGLL